MSESWKQWEGQVVHGVYHLRQYLGGAEGCAVFLTEHGAPEPRACVIKLIAEELAGAELQLSHWSQAAKLSHPHLLRLYQSGRCQLGDMRLLFVVQEYAEENLLQILPQRMLTPTEARDMLKPALSALAYIHSEGFVHGGIQPANIMAAGDQIKLASDRLSRLGEPLCGVARLGTYDPPEAASGLISPAGDVWSLAVTLCEALTQRLPIWEAREQREPELPETLPAPFFEIVQQSLQRDPQRRWRIADIAARLQQTSPTPRQKTNVRTQDPAAKRRLMLFAAAAGLVLAAILAKMWLFNPHSEMHHEASIASTQPELQSNPRSNQKTSPQKPAPGQPVQTGSGKPPDSAVISSSPASIHSLPRAQSDTAGVLPPGVVQQFVPNVSQKARDTIQGKLKVRVRVQVDASGDVAGADFENPGPSKYFADLAIEAARRWKFAPASAADGSEASRDWLLQFEFERTATRVVARAAP